MEGRLGLERGCGFESQLCRVTWGKLLAPLISLSFNDLGSFVKRIK